MIGHAVEIDYHGSHVVVVLVVDEVLLVELVVLEVVLVVLLTVIP